MKGSYDAVVIGSGFGGAVAACRLAQAGFSVAILERGRRYATGQFPRNWRNPLDGWAWSHNQGLVDVKPIREMQIVQAAGFGGGSLVYANVHLRAIPEVFEQGWPTGFSRAALDPYYDLVASMLDIRPITDSLSGLPPKTAFMGEAASRLKRAQLVYPNLAITFPRKAATDGGAPLLPGDPVMNRFGKEQRACTYCGECVVGCNIHAKNTLDLNYLAEAERRGAEANVLCEVTRIQPDGAGGYEVKYLDHANGGVECTVGASRVFVCAGSINSTELLLRCRDEHKTLPNLSARLGERYSGNGDLIAFAFRTKEPFSAPEGPTITSGIVFDRQVGDRRLWFILEEGGYPKQLAGIVNAINQPEGMTGAFNLLKQDIERELRSRFAAAAGAANDDPLDIQVGIFLAMGRDMANGRIVLDHSALSGRPRLGVKWHLDTNLPLYDAQQQLANDVAEAMGGKIAYEPFWKRLHIPISVHNLGGCAMADRAEDGVVDPTGEVFGHPGLFVLDGAILPTATGVNPAHTIAAVAEHNIERIINRIIDGTANGIANRTGNDGDKAKGHWEAPEKKDARPIIDPITRIYPTPADLTPPPESPLIGLRYREVLKGNVSGVADPHWQIDFQAAEARGKKQGSKMTANLRIVLPDLDAFLVDPAHAGSVSGTLSIDGYTGADPVQIENGAYNLIDPEAAAGSEDEANRCVLYLLPFNGADGVPYLLEGRKKLIGSHHENPWKAVTTLYALLREGHSREGQVVAAGILHLTDVAGAYNNFTVTGIDDTVGKAQAAARFGERLLGDLWKGIGRADFVAWVNSMFGGHEP